MGTRKTTSRMYYDVVIDAIIKANGTVAEIYGCL